MKQYAQSGVEEIRKLVPVEHWNHCSGVENPGDIPSRGILPTHLALSELWWSGRDWLTLTGIPAKENVNIEFLPDECRNEMKVKDQRALNKETVSALVAHGSKSSLDRLLRVTAA